MFSKASSQPSQSKGLEVGPFLRNAWPRLSRIPGGKWLFSRLIGLIAPYSGTIAAQVNELRPGYACVSMSDRRRVRNHLRCVHAIALMNLAEMASGLAVCYDLPPGARGIITDLHIHFHKKARGPLVARTGSTCTLPGDDGLSMQIGVTIYNQKQEAVATATADWLVSPAASQAQQLALFGS